MSDVIDIKFWDSVEHAIVFTRTHMRSSIGSFFFRFYSRWCLVERNPLTSAPVAPSFVPVMLSGYGRAPFLHCRF
jgi:hypothetical protein